jgi:hypothetical protein
MFEGVELPQRKFIVSRYWTSHNGDPYGAALGRILYPLVKFRRRAIESYVLFGDRYATPTAVAKAPLSASTRELDTLYGHLSNLSQETAMILPEGYELDFVTPSGSPEVFKNLIDYIDKEISLVICGEDEAGRAEAGSRASSQVANTIRVVRASELSERLSHTLSQTLVRWIVDLNFGTDVAAPTLTREFRIEESPITVPDLSLLIQSGFTPRKEWIERHFRVELEEKKEGEEEENTTFDPQQDQDLFGDIFGGEAGAAGGNEAAAEADLDAAANVMDEPAGATPEESQADAIGEPSGGDEIDNLIASLTSDEPAGATPEESQADAIGEPSGGDEIDNLIASLTSDEPEEGEEDEGDLDSISEDDELMALLQPDEEEEPKKPFGDEKITEDEAVEMAKE